MRPVGPPIFDEWCGEAIHKAMQPIGERLRELGNRMNQFSIGVEAASFEFEKARKAEEKRKARFREQQNRCLRGKRPFPIYYSPFIQFKCPQCGREDAYFTDSEMACLGYPCAWSRKLRFPAPPSPSYTNKTIRQIYEHLVSTGKGHGLGRDPV